jgi:hypothetical protein
MAHQNIAGVLTGRGLMDCLQYYDNCLFIMAFCFLCYIKYIVNNVFYAKCFSEMFLLKTWFHHIVMFLVLLIKFYTVFEKDDN